MTSAEINVLISRMKSLEVFLEGYMRNIEECEISRDTARVAVTDVIAHLRSLLVPA
jgi:hypothetical protein